MTEPKACPLCGKMPELETINGIQFVNHHCFYQCMANGPTVEDWNKRPIEDEITTRLNNVIDQLVDEQIKNNKYAGRNVRLKFAISFAMGCLRNALNVSDVVDRQETNNAYETLLRTLETSVELDVVK